VVTILVTVSTDLMVGILSGIVLKFCFLVYYNSKSSRSRNISVATSLFKNPVLQFQQSLDCTTIDIAGPVACFNSLHLRAACDKAIERRQPIRINILPTVNVVDHSSSTYLHSVQLDCERAGIEFSIHGLEALKARTNEPHSLKYRLSPQTAFSEGSTHLLLVIDASEHSDTAVEEVISTSWSKGSEIVVATVINVPFGMSVSAQHTEKANQLVHSVAERIEKGNKALGRVEPIVMIGDRKSQIYALMQKYQPDLLITGTRSNSVISKKLLGSLSHALLLMADCSVRVCRPKRSDTGNRVMLALDGSKFSRSALENVATRPWAANTEFLCVSAVPSLGECSYEFQDSYSIADMERNRHKQVESAREMLDNATELLISRLGNCTVKAKVVDGDPREALAKIAEEESIDLIVLGSAGKNFAERFVVGSISETVAVCANCSVEVVNQRTRRQSNIENVPKMQSTPIAFAEPSVH
jgi:nucleotide-binding universal stress UspA family protein